MEFKRSTITMSVSSYLGEGESMQPIHPGESREISLKVLLENYYHWYLDKASDTDMAGYGIINHKSAIKTVNIYFYKPYSPGIPRRRFSRDVNSPYRSEFRVINEESNNVFPIANSPQVLHHEVGVVGVNVINEAANNPHNPHNPPLPPSPHPLPLQPGPGIPDFSVVWPDNNSVPPIQIPRIQANLILGNSIVKSVEITGENPNLLYEPIVYTDDYKLRIINKHTSDILEDLVIEINYLTPFPVLIKTIPLNFFQNAFDSIWNNRDLRYIDFHAEDEKLYLKYDPELKVVYPGLHLDDKVFGQDFPIIDFDEDKIDFRFDITSMKNLQTNIYEPTIVWKININQGKLKILSYEIDLSKLNDIVVEYKINMRNTRLDFIVKCQFLDDIFEYATLNDPANEIISNIPHFGVDVNAYLHNLRDKIYDSLNPVPDAWSTTLYYWFMGRYDATEVGGVRSDNANMYIYYVDYLLPKSDHDLSFDSTGSHVTHSRPQSIHVHTPVHPEGHIPNTEKVDHIVFVMMENRSYDQMLGYLNLQDNLIDTQSGAIMHGTGNVGVNQNYTDGLNGSEYNEDIHHDNERYFVNHITNTKIKPGPAHETENMTNQMAVEDGVPTMKGFVNDYRNRLTASGFSEIEIRNKLHEVMSFYTEAEVPVFDYLAKNFAICKRWFSSHPGPTLTNRFITLTGDLLDQQGEIFENHPSHFGEFYPIQAKTIFEYLNDFGVSWNYFEKEYCTLRLFGKYTFDKKHILDIDKFHEMALNGTLPQVTFIDPDYIDLPPGNDDHAPANITCGQNFLGEIVTSLQNGPNWEKTLLIITYDENGGFFDHVPPPEAPIISSGRAFYGPRVPTFVISPYIPKVPDRITVFPTEDVDNNVFDHTSVVATILRKFCAGNVPNLGIRTNQAKDLWHLLSLSEPRTVTKIDNIPTCPEIRSKYTFDKLDDKDGFHHLVLSHGMLFRG